MPKPLTGRRLLAAFAKHVCGWSKEGVQEFMDQAPTNLPRLSAVMEYIRVWCERNDKGVHAPLGFELKWYPDPDIPYFASVGREGGESDSLGYDFARTPQTALMRAAVDAALSAKERSKR